jgi:Protein of unknown function (DUF2384)
MAAALRALAPHEEVATPSVVLTKAVLRAAMRLGVSSALLARVIGVSEATVSRMRAGAHVLPATGKPFELAALFVRLTRDLDLLTGGDDAAARSWFTTDNTALGGRPADLVVTVQGLMSAAIYVDSRAGRL